MMSRGKKTYFSIFFLPLVFLFSFCQPFPSSKKSPSLSVLKRTRQNAVTISEANNTRSNGTGVLISSKLVLTCEHVIHDFSSMILIRRNPSLGEYRSAKILFSQPDMDLVLLELDYPLPETPLLRPVSYVSRGEELHSHGAPYSLEDTTLFGRVSDPNAKGKDVLSPFVPYIHVQGLTYPGLSGGGVFDRYGRFVGISRATVGFSSSTGIGFVFPWSYIKEFLNLENSPLQGQF